MSKNDLSIKIRPIESKDNKEIQKIIKKSLEKHDLNKPGTAYYDPQLDTLYQFYKHLPKSGYWVAIDETNQTIVGGIGIGAFGDYKNIAELQKYYISNEYQGFGIGSLLFQEAISFARHINYQSLYIETMDTLAKANSIYEHYGFRQLSEPLEGSQHGLMNRWYIKDL